MGKKIIILPFMRCKQLINLIKDAMEDTQYNYLILFQNQKIAGNSPRGYREKSWQCKSIMICEKKLWHDSSDDAAKKAWYAAKTVEEELKIFQEELWQLKL